MHKQSPTTWQEMKPLLLGGVCLWISLLLYSLVRVASYSAFYSKSFQKALRRKRASYAIRLYVWFGRKWRAGRAWLLRYQLPEVLVASYFGLFRVFYGSLICVLYISQTYMEVVPRSFRFVQIVYGFAVGIKLLLSFAYTNDPLLFVLSFHVILDCLSLPSMLFPSESSWLNLTFLQAVPILHQWSMLEKHDIVLVNTSTMVRLLVNLLLQLLTFFFVASCGIQFFELLDDPFASFTSARFQITFANAVYAGVVTVMSIGYGDFVPYTLLGRLWIITHVIYAAYLITREISELIGTVQSIQQGSGAFSKTSDTPHIIVTGQVKWDYLRQFFREFLVERDNLGTNIVVLASSSEWPDNAWRNFVTHDPFYDHHLSYLEGSSLNFKDLERAKVDSASAVFLFADPHTSDAYRTDSITLKSVLTIRASRPTIPIFAMSALVESTFQFCIASALKHDEDMDDVELNARPRNKVARIQRTLHSLASFWTLSPALRQFQNRAQRAGEDPRSMENEPLLRPGRESDPLTPSSLHRRRGSIQGKYREFGKSGRQKMESETLCMQEMETAVLAESVFCHGLSTLISNLLLRIVPTSTVNDRPWLLEYKVGAECALHTMYIPREFHGHCHGEMAPVLYDYGLVIIAVRGENRWRMVKPEMKLQTGFEAVVMTYHDQAVVGKIADLVSGYLRKQQGASDSDEDLGTGPLDTTTPPRANPRDITLGTCSSDWLYASDEESQFSGRAERRASFMSPDMSGRALQASSLNARNPFAGRRASGGETRGLGSIPMGVSPGRRQGKRSRIIIGDESIASNISGHIVVCLAGRCSLLNLAALVSRISTAQGGSLTKNPILVIHSGSSKDYAQEIDDSNIEGDVYLIEGNGLRVDVLGKVKYRKARAIIIVSGGEEDVRGVRQPSARERERDNVSENDKVQRRFTGNATLDSKAIFMVMTLDYLLGEKTEVFVCCILGAEESLQLLRAPKHERRLGTNNKGRRGTYGLSAGIESSSRRSASPDSTSISSMLGYSPYFPAQESTVAGFRLPREPSLSTGISVRRSTSVRFDELGPLREFGSGDVGIRNSLHKAKDAEVLTSQKSKEEFLERQRYASGELMISSLFTTLLVREYMTTGFISFMQELIGACSERPKSWIRLLTIPSDWIHNADTMDGRTYRETFVRLLEMGCTVLGLYRSGEAPIRVEVDSEALEESHGDMDYFHDNLLGARRQSQEFSAENEFSVSFGTNDSYGAFSASDAGSESSRRGDANVGPRSFHEDSKSDDGAQFEEMFYICPTTKRKIRYEEGLNGENVLPYVYTNPEPYTLVAASDRLFVLCDPDLSIPTQW